MTGFCRRAATRLLTASLTAAALATAMAVSAQVDLDPDYLAAIQPERYTAYRAAGTIEIDGALDEPSWQQAPWTRAFVDIEGDVRPEPRFLTRAKMLWDDEHFYVAALMEEPHVWATLTERDAVIFHDNDFEIFIDPDWDTHNYYEYEANAFGTEWDLLLVRPYRDGAPPVHAWDIPGLRTGVRVYGTINQPDDEDEGWSVEVAFPWEGLRRPSLSPVPPQDSHVWRINFSRVEWQVEAAEDGQGYSKLEGTSEDNWVWSPQGLVNMHFPEQWGYVRFSAEPVSATSGAGPFDLPPEAEAYRLLREIYWRQLVYQQTHQRYTGSLDTLGVAHRLMRHFLWPPTVQVTDYGYQAWVEEVTDLHDDGSISRWLLSADSRVQKVEARD